MVISGRILFQQFFRDLHRIERGALEKLISDNPKAQAVIEGAVFADAPDLTIVALGDVKGEGIFGFLWIINDIQPGRPGEDLASRVDRDRLFGGDAAGKRCGDGRTVGQPRERSALERAKMDLPDEPRRSKTSDSARKRTSDNRLSGPGDGMRHTAPSASTRSSPLAIRLQYQDAAGDGGSKW